MIKPVTFWQRSLVYVICWTFNIQPLLAHVIVDNSQHNTSVNHAGNGVEVVNIATPNANGLSHNQYQQFNVDPSGLILNNSTAQVAQSQLGGYLQNNPNLHGQAATVILNEVTGASRSQLQGYTEVFGQGANVILTNPYGITCNGCGFINTPRVTLSTGTPLIDNGNVTGFDVSQGSVSIEGLGLDATHQSYFDIITRTAQLNAEIHANDLSVVTGKNRVSYQSNQVTATTADDQDTAPELAIDSSNLGGMYAGRIALVATDAGVGVNVGNLSASQGEIQISADGQVTLGKSSAQTNLAVSSQSGVTLKGSQYAKQAVSVSGQTVHADSDILAAGQSVSLTAADAVTLNQSLVEAGVDADGNRLTGGIVNVQSHDLNINASNLIANQQLTTKVRHATVDQDSLMYGQEMTLNQLGKLDNRGTVAATHQLSVNGTEASLVGDGHLTASDITINSDRLTLDTHLTAQTLDVQARQALTTDEHSDVSAAEQLTVTAGTLNQQGKLTTRGDMNIDATAATLKGHVAAQNLHVKAQRLTQESGILQAGQALDISGGSVTLSGDSAANTSVGIQADQLTLNGTLQSGGETRLTVDGKMQTGDDSQLVTQGRLLATVDVLTQRGTMQSGEDVTLTGHTLNNEGDVSALGNTHLTAQAQLTNRGTVTSGQQLVIDGGAVTNSGELSAQQDTNVTVTGQLDNQANGLISGQVTTVQAKSVNNAGQLQALTDLGLTTDALNNRGTLAALSDATLTVTHHFTNRGTVSAAHDARLLTDNLTNSGHIVARDNLLIAKDTNQSRNTTFDNTDGSLNAESGNLTIATQGDLQVSAGQHLFAGKNLTLTAATLNNSAEITAQDNTRLILDGVTTAHAGLTNQTDALISGQTTSIDAQSVNNHGQLQALGNLGLTVSSLENSGTLTALNTTLSVSDHLLNTGAVSAVEHVSLLAAQVDNQGTVYAGAHLLVAADQQQNRSDSLNNAGRFETHNGDIEIVTDTVTQQQSGHIIAGHDLRLDGHQLDNGGELAATHHTDLTLDQHVLNRDTGLISGQATRLNAHAVNNQGQLQSLSDLGLTAESFENSGVLAGLANVTLHITHDLTSRGSVLAGNHIVLNAGRIDNQGRVSAGDQAIVTAKPSATGSDVGLTVTADTLTNSGQLLAQGNNQLTINADLTNQTGGLISGQATTVKARSVTNAGQLQSLSDLGLTANALANSGTLAALSDMTLNVANQLSNSGAISANHNASLLTDNLTNKGRVFAGNNLLIAKDTNQTRNTTFDNTDGSLNAKAGHLTIATHGDVMVSAGQHWMAEQDVTLHANSLTNDGEVSAQGETSLTLDNALTNHGLVSGQSTTVTAQSVTNTGQMQALTNLGLTTDALDNSGTFVAFNDVDLTVTDRLLNRGSGAVLAGENIKLSAALIDNQGRVSAGDGAIMTPEQRTAEQTESDLIVTADTLTNSGELLAQGNNQLTIKADLTNQTGGLISGQLTTVKAPSVTNLGQLQSLSALGLTADALDNSGTLAALSDMTLNVANQLSNSGAISANHNASLLTDNLTNKGRVFAGNNLLIAKDTNQTRNTTFNNTDGSLTAKAGQLTIATHGDVMVSAGQHWTAGQDVTLQANRLTNDGEVSAQGNTALTLDNALTNHGLVSGQNTTLVAQSVTNTGQLQSLSDLGLTADALDNSGTLVAFNDIDLTVTDRLLNRGSGAVLAGENIKLSAALIDNQGRVSAGDQAIMTPEQRTVEQTESDLIVTADALTNSGELLALGNNQLTINTDLTNQTGGLISGQATTVKAQSVTNAGQLQSLSDLGLTADALDNSGTLAALSDMTLNVVNRLSNSGAISANHNASLLTDNLINKGRVFAGNNLLIAKDTHQTRNTSFDNTDGSLTAKAGHLTVATHGDVSVSAGQHWMAGQDVTVYANSLINNGEVTAQGETSLTLDNAFTNHGLVSGQNTTVKSQSVSNTGQLQSLSALGLTADALDNSGTLAALSDITLNVANQLSNSGAISASHNASLLTDNLTNKGAVFAGHDLLIAKDSNQTRNTTFDNTDGSLTAKAGHLTIATHDDVSVSTGQHWVAGQNLTLQANSLTNDGEVSAQGNTSLTLNHALTNHGLVSGQKATITSQSVTNTGQLQSLSDLGLTADALDNSGTLAALNDMTLNIANQLSNSGAISANHDASLLTDNLTNHGTVLAGHDLLIAKDTHQTRNTTFDNTDGSLTAKAGQLTIATHGDVMVSAGQHWMAGQDVTVHADSLTNDGEVSAQGNTSLTLDNALTNHGLVSGQSTTIRAQSVTNIGQMQSLTDFGLTTDALNNSGTLVAFNDIDLTVTDRLLNRGSGAVLAGENIKLSAALIDNQGRVSAGDQAIMTPEQRTVEQTESDLIVTADTLTNSGELLAQGHNQLTINTDLTNQTGGLISGQATTVKAQSVTNLGQLQSLSALGLTADALDNSGTLAALSDMTLNVANQLSNSGAISANHNASLLTDNLTNKGRVFAGNNLLVAKDSNQTRNTTFDNTDGSLNAKAGHLTVATHGDVIVSAEQHWMAGQDVTVYANSLTNGGEVTAQGETSLTLDNAFTNHGLVSGQNTTVKSQSVSNTGQLQSLNDLGLTADALDNSGTLAALNDITLNVVNQLGNSGTVSADHDASLLTDNLSNHGRVFADNNLLIAKDTNQTRNTTFDNTDGSLTAKAGHLTIATHDDVSVSTGQHWVAGQNLTLQANSLTNDGEVSAQGNTSLTLNHALTNHGLVSGQKATITSQSVTNTGQLQSLSDLGLTADALDNSGTLAALNDMTLNVANQLSNSGAISANHDASLLTDNLSNHGRVFAGHDLLIAKDTHQTRNTTFNNTDGSLTAKAGHLIVATHGDVMVSAGQHWVAGQNLTLQANSLTNDGEVSAQGNTSLTLNDALTNHGLISGQSTTVTTHSVTNSGQLQSLSDLGLTTNALANSGTLAALSDITLNVVNQLSNSGAISANHDASLLTDHLTNKGRVFADNNLLIARDSAQTRNTTFDNTDGSLNAKAGHLTVATHDNVMVSAGQHWIAGQGLTLQANSLTNNGEVSTQGNTALALDNALTNHGLISGQSTTVTTQSVTNTGQLQALTDLGLNAGVLANSGALVAGRNAVFNIIHTLTSHGNISAGNNASLLADQVNNQNKIYAGNSVLIAKDSAQTRSSSLINSGQIDAKHGSITIATQGDFTVGAGQHISAGKDLTLVAAALTNDGELSSQGTTTIGVDGIGVDGTGVDGTGVDGTGVGGTLTNHTAGIISGQNTVLRAGTTTNQGQLQALNDLHLTTGSLTNTGSLVALNDMTVHATGHIDNHSLLYAGRNGNLFSDTLTNYSDIVVGNDLLIARDSNKTRSRNLTNSSGSIESLGGNIGIYADSVLNKRTVLDIVNQTQDLRGNIPGGGGDIVPADFDNIAVKRAYDSCSYCDKPGKKIFVNGKPHIIGESSDAPFALDVTIGSGGYSIGRNGPSIDYVYYYIIGGKTYSAVAYQESETLKNATPQGRIAAGNNLNIYADNLANESSLISGKNVAISVTHLLNQGHQFNRFITYFDYSLKPRRGGAWLWNVGGHSYKDDGLLSFSGIGNSRYSPDSFYLQGTRRVQVGSGSVLQSSITARDNLTLNVQNRTNNSVIGINAAGMQPTQSARTTRATQGPLGVQADVQTTQHTPGTGQGVTSTQDVSDSAQSLQTAQGGGIAQGVQATQGSSDTTPSLQTAQGGGTAQGIQVTQGPSDTTPSLQTAQGAGTAQSVQMTQGSSDTSGTTPSFQTAQGSGTAQSIQVTQGSSDTSGTVQSQSATTHRMQLTPLADDSGAALQSGQAQSDSGLAAQSTPNMTSMTRPVPQGGKSATTVTLSNSSAVTAPTVNLPNQNSIPFPDYRLPTSPHGLFVFSDGPQSDYLIATNPAVTNLNNFLGSDYFKDQLNYDPEQKEKFLGDAYYDTRTITQEI
ncbi:two-partner secretion domain-containing protein, partial [Vibrio spartinae]